jgi:hypothetical protein
MQIHARPDGGGGAVFARTGGRRGLAKPRPIGRRGGDWRGSEPRGWRGSRQPLAIGPEYVYARFVCGLPFATDAAQGRVAGE